MKTRQAALAAALAPRLDSDALLLDLVLSQLRKTSDIYNATLVCKAWAAAAQVEAIWENAAKSSYPTEKHAAVYRTFDVLGVHGWRARCKLLSQREAPPIAVSKTSSLNDLAENFTFVVAVQDGDGNALSSQAALIDRGSSHDDFELMVTFDEPVDMNVGVYGDWLHEDTDERYNVTDGFGFANIDVFVKRESDGKVALLANCEYDFDKPFGDIHGCRDQHDNDMVHFGQEDDHVRPSWLSEHVHDVYPNLAWGRSNGKRNYPRAGRLYPRGVLQWPHAYDASLEPKWNVTINVWGHAPPPLEGLAEDDNSSSSDSQEDPKTGKWAGFELRFYWAFDFGAELGIGGDAVVENYFIVQALSGRAVAWV